MPRVSADQGYAQLVNDGLSPARRLDEQRVFEDAFAASIATPRDDPPQQPAVPNRPTPSPRPQAPPLDLRPLSAASPGLEVVVPAELWPRHTCTENGGAGWSAVTTSLTSVTAVVHFTLATTRDGRPYADHRLTLRDLRVACPPR